MCSHGEAGEANVALWNQNLVRVVSVTPDVHRCRGVGHFCKEIRDVLRTRVSLHIVWLEVICQTERYISCIYQKRLGKVAVTVISGCVSTSSPIEGCGSCGGATSFQRLEWATSPHGRLDNFESCCSCFLVLFFCGHF